MFAASMSSTEALPNTNTSMCIHAGAQKQHTLGKLADTLGWMMGAVVVCQQCGWLFIRRGHAASVGCVPLVRLSLTLVAFLDDDEFVCAVAPVILHTHAL